MYMYMYVDVVLTLYVIIARTFICTFSQGDLSIPENMCGFYKGHRHSVMTIFLNLEKEANDNYG